MTAGGGIGFGAQDFVVERLARVAMNEIACEAQVRECQRDGVPAGGIGGSRSLHADHRPVGGQRGLHLVQIRAQRGNGGGGLLQRDRRSQPDAERGGRGFRRWRRRGTGAGGRQAEEKAGREKEEELPRLHDARHPKDRAGKGQSFPWSVPAFEVAAAGRFSTEDHEGREGRESSLALSS